MVITNLLSIVKLPVLQLGCCVATITYGIALHTGTRTPCHHCALVGSLLFVAGVFGNFGRHCGMQTIVPRNGCDPGWLRHNQLREVRIHRYTWWRWYATRVRMRSVIQYSAVYAKGLKRPVLVGDSAMLLGWRKQHIVRCINRNLSRALLLSAHARRAGKYRRGRWNTCKLHV
jgi:hypothetical protein